MTDSNWRLYVEGNALIAEFPEGMPSDKEEYEKVNQRFEQLATQDGVDAHISVLNMDAALNEDVFRKAREAAEIGAEYGITKWAIVSADIKSMALNSKIKDVPGVETTTAETTDEALAWTTA
jgi:outer membrane protein W